jgi:hypothetical protein
MLRELEIRRKENQVDKGDYHQICLLRFLNLFFKSNKDVRMDQGSTLRSPRLVVRSNNKGWQGHKERSREVVYG